VSDRSVLRANLERDAATRRINRRKKPNVPIKRARTVVVVPSTRALSRRADTGGDPRASYSTAISPLRGGIKSARRTTPADDDAAWQVFPEAGRRAINPR